MIKVVHGDTANITITVTSGANAIREMYFSSKALNITKPLEKLDNTRWHVSFETSEIKNITDDIRTTYDITAKLLEDQTLTLIYNDKIEVYYKDNPVNGR